MDPKDTETLPILRHQIILRCPKSFSILSISQIKEDKLNIHPLTFKLSCHEKSLQMLFDPKWKVVPSSKIFSWNFNENILTSLFISLIKLRNTSSEYESSWKLQLYSYISKSNANKFVALGSFLHYTWFHWHLQSIKWNRYQICWTKLR